MALVKLLGVPSWETGLDDILDAGLSMDEGDFVPDLISSGDLFYFGDYCRPSSSYSSSFVFLPSDIPPELCTFIYYWSNYYLIAISYLIR